MWVGLGAWGAPIPWFQHGACSGVTTCSGPNVWYTERGVNTETLKYNVFSADADLVNSVSFDAARFDSIQSDMILINSIWSSWIAAFR